jgi:glutathione S-transferase
MYQLPYFPANANAAPHMLREEIGIRYDLVLVDRARNARNSGDYLKNNPNGRIPTLVDGDLVVSEAAAIVLHLVDQHADTGLAPQVRTPERAKFYQWLTFLANSRHEELMMAAAFALQHRKASRQGDTVADGPDHRAFVFRCAHRVCRHPFSFLAWAASARIAQPNRERV